MSGAAMTVAPPAPAAATWRPRRASPSATRGSPIWRRRSRGALATPEAMTYLGAALAAKIFAFFTDPIAWQGAVDEADSWQQKAADARAGKS